jgi:hypothetical protein
LTAAAPVLAATPVHSCYFCWQLRLLLLSQLLLLSRLLVMPAAVAHATATAPGWLVAPVAAMTAAAPAAALMAAAPAAAECLAAGPFLLSSHLFFSSSLAPSFSR